MGIVWWGRRGAATGTAATKCHAGRVRTGSLLMCGVLAAAAIASCAGGDSADGDSPAEAPGLSSTTTSMPGGDSAGGDSPVALSPSSVCDVVALSEAAGGGPGPDGRYTTTVRLVAYGDVDSDDDVPCGMLPDVRIAVISEEGAYSAYAERDNMLNWWTVVGGSELGIERFIPPGVRVLSTAEGLLAAPAQFVTTGPDGTVEVPIAYDRGSDSDSFCAISPIGDLIAGCRHHLSLGNRSKRSNYYITVYIYFTHGHAILDVGSSDRYQRFLDGEESSWELAIVKFEATDYDDVAPSRPASNVDIIIVDDDHVNAWWAAVSDNGANELDADRVVIDSEVLIHDWVHVVTTGQDGLAETTLLPGDYLMCPVNWRGHLVCAYENLANGHHKYNVDFSSGGNHTAFIKTSSGKPSSRVVAAD